MATLTDPQVEAQAILLGAAPGIVDELVLWAVGAHLAWHARQIASAWDHGRLVESDSVGGTLSQGPRWRSLTANRRQAVLVDRRGHRVLVVQLADVVKLIANERLFPAELVAEIRGLLAERDAVNAADREAWSRQMTGQREPAELWEARRIAGDGLNRRCELAAAEVWRHVRPADALFDPPVGGAR